MEGPFNMDALSQNCKPVAGQWLARNQLSLAARAFEAADLMIGASRLIKPTLRQVSFLARVNSTYVHWAVKQQAERELILLGCRPLVPRPMPEISPFTMSAMPTVETVGPLLTDDELMAIARANGTERVFQALEALL